MSNNLGNIKNESIFRNNSSEKFLGMPGIKPGATGCKVRALSSVLCVPPELYSLCLRTLLGLLVLQLFVAKTFVPIFLFWQSSSEKELPINFFANSLPVENSQENVFLSKLCQHRFQLKKGSLMHLRPTANNYD